VKGKLMIQQLRSLEKGDSAEQGGEGGIPKRFRQYSSQN